MPSSSSFRASVTRRLSGLVRKLSKRGKENDEVDTITLQGNTITASLTLSTTRSNAATADALASGDDWRAGLAGWGAVEAAGAEAKGRRGGKASKKDKKKNNKNNDYINQNDRKICKLAPSVTPAWSVSQPLNLPALPPPPLPPCADIRFGPAVALDSGSHTPTSAPSSPSKSCLKRSPSTDTAVTAGSYFGARPAATHSAEGLLDMSCAATLARAELTQSLVALNEALDAEWEAEVRAWRAANPLPPAPTGPRSVCGLGPYELARASDESLCDPVMHARKETDVSAKKTVVVAAERLYGFF